MRKFTFICEEGNSKTVVEFQAYGFYDVLPKINQFVKASGFKVGDLSEIAEQEKSYGKPIPNNSITYHNGLTAAQLTTTNFQSSDKEQGVWKDYKFDTSKIDHINEISKQSYYPTMAPLTSEQVYSWSVNPIQPLTSIDISALTTANLTALKPEDISGLNYKFNL